ncbi:MAG TPA: ferrous iron transport protein A [Candidatus Atribacteria bacterium]|uniref:FeoA family protein n=1 Tax=Candidatus Sordicultor fermentans TaxID=1953203 RepID=UPI002A2EB63C|nr:ferrous iron transport protein A [Atribacterota bacterium]HOA99617.1 ferrous iron transport protein A [Candidatus Atribacteria bacterium]MDI9607377.1 ferrous iron transport protein A [Atribacterota bacterium]MDY0135205.1 ferrous iron transport protein A [Atribacterota bacterium]HOQ51325.1 ferrous iron transport protein A [Candidatus Atribacteria bacterium]
MEKKQMSLVEMPPGQEGTVVAIDGGQGVVNRLWVMGIFPGRKITKLASLPAQGPVVIKVGNQELALGRGMAQKVIVEVTR